MKEESLLPCPFCGGEPEEEAGCVSEYYGHEHQDYSISCTKCGAEVYCNVGTFDGADVPCSCHYDTRKVCVDKWNMRPTAAPAAQAEQLSGNTEQVSQPVLPLDYLQGHKDGLEWAAQLAEANHPQTGDWLYDDPIALAAAIRKGSDMPELKSAFADEDDNFYSWFGRFWLENYQQNNYTTSAKQMLGTMAEFAFRAGRESATQAGNSPLIPDGWLAEAERLAELHGASFVIFRHGQAPVCADPSKFWFGYDPAAPQQEAE